MNRILLPVPHLQQQERGECLAACAAMLLAYLGRPVRYKHLLKVLQIRSQIGAPASHIRKLEQPELKVVYQQGTLPDFQEQLTNNRPCIVFIKTGELPYGVRIVITLSWLPDWMMNLFISMIRRFLTRRCKFLAVILIWPGWGETSFLQL